PLRDPRELPSLPTRRSSDLANGATRDQMTNVLHLPADRAKGLEAGDLGRFYTRPGRPYALAVANALWGQKGLSWRPEFRARQQGDRKSTRLNSSHRTISYAV